MGKDLEELAAGEIGTIGIGTITIPAWIIVDLARWCDSSADVSKRFPEKQNSITNLILFYKIAEYADIIEQQEGKPISNRKRVWSKNKIVPRT